MPIRAFLCCGRGSDIAEAKKKPGTWRVFSLKELHSATNNFNYDNKLGEGGFGSVYWGQLWDGSQIAVKRLKIWKTNSETEFAAELEAIARIKHKNLLGIRGYCSEGQERLIVYEYMPNLSLFSHLHGHNSKDSVLDWTRRFNIAICSAEGISHLHNSQIVHLDIKASNVLLDANFQPCVSDFGIANLIPDGSAYESTKAKAATGYSAPEYSIGGKSTPSCDAYSLGVLLLEIATGKRPLERTSTTEKIAIADWALPLARDRSYTELADPRLDRAYDEDEMSRVVMVGLLCAQADPEKRPSLADALQLLKSNEKHVISKLEDRLFNRETEEDEIGI